MVKFTKLASLGILGALLGTIAPWREAVTQSVQPLTVQVRGAILSSVLHGRRDILNDRSPVDGCSIFKLLDSRPDYLSLLDSLARPMVDVGSPAPCSPNRIWSDTTLTPFERRRRLLAVRPSSITVESIEWKGGNVEVTLGVARPGYLCREIHRLSPRVFPGEPTWWWIGEISVTVIGVI